MGTKKLAKRDGVFALVRRGYRCPDCGSDCWELRLSCYVCEECYKCNGTSHDTSEAVKLVLGGHQTRGEVLLD